ncbi:unnamed protein product [Sphagnum troendelagicum]
MPNPPEYWLQFQRRFRFLKTQQADVARDDGAAASHLQPHLASSDRSSDGVQRGVTRPQFPRQLLLQEHHHHRGVLGYPTHLFHQALLQQMIALQAADAHQTATAAVGCPRHWRRIKRDLTTRGDSSSSSSAPPYQPQQVW